MIIDNTYFKGEIYIPHAKPSVTDEVTGVEQDILTFINEYSNDCLVKCLGPQLRDELVDNLDSSALSWVDALADTKWDELVNGKSYIDPNTNLPVKWRGIRWKDDILDGTVYNRSFLAYYVYFFYEREDYITRSTLGQQIDSAEGARVVLPTFKVVTAWNKFVELVQGKNSKPATYLTKFGLGIDYASESAEVSLYKFINDMNTISEDTYANFEPHSWTKMNQFNL